MRGSLSDGLSHSATRLSMSAWARAPNACLRPSLVRRGWAAASNTGPSLAARMNGLRIGGGKCSNASQLVRTSAPNRCGVAVADDLRDCAPGVVADQHHVIELERVEEFADDRGDPLHRQVGFLAHRLGMGTQGPGRRKAEQAALGKPFGQRTLERRPSRSRGRRGAGGRPRALTSHNGLDLS